MTELTQARLKELLDYDPATGLFRRRIKVGGRPVGAVAGVIDLEGYRIIRVDGQKRKAHRLAFLWMTGSIPDSVIDHANGRKDDNSWSNLREATRSENAANSCARAGKALPKGVFERGGRYRAIVCKDGRNRHLGTFDTADGAAAAYAEAAVQLFAEFARLS